MTKECSTQGKEVECTQSLKLKTLLYEGANGMKPLVTEYVTICNYWYLRCEVKEVLLLTSLPWKCAQRST
jgi:hypothetical protein